jgi:hypothetical protein
MKDAVRFVKVERFKGHAGNQASDTAAASVDGRLQGRAKLASTLAAKEPRFPASQ